MRWNQLNKNGYTRSEAKTVCVRPRARTHDKAVINIYSKKIFPIFIYDFDQISNRDDWPNTRFIK